MVLINNKVTIQPNTHVVNYNLTYKINYTVSKPVYSWQ